MTPHAEVIGDPVAHSKSPVIHRAWLDALGREGAFAATRVAGPDLPAFFAARRRDPSWRGCSVTAPHKLAITALLDGITDAAAAVGAVNCVHRDGQRLLGTNTDVDGVLRALDGVQLAGRRAVLIGAGGAARAGIAALRRLGAAEIVVLARDPARASAGLPPGVRAALIDQAAAEIAGAALLVNASPLGMADAAPMPQAILAALANAAGATVFDMVYAPLETELLAAARMRGLPAIDGLAMLVGQARRAFALFFGADAPGDVDIRARLIASAPP